MKLFLTAFISLFVLLMAQITPANAEMILVETPEAQLIERVGIPGEIIDVRPLCPEDMTCVTNGTVVELNFRLLGCADELLSMSHSVEVEDGNIYLKIKAVNGVMKESQVIRCYAPVYERRTITLIGVYGENVFAEFLNVGERVLSRLSLLTGAGTIERVDNTLQEIF